MAQARRAATRRRVARKPAPRKPAARKPARRAVARKPARRGGAKAASRAATRPAARRSTAARRPVRRAAPKRATPPPAPPGAGIFIWHELMTPNVARSKDFYGQLFGWQSRGMDMGNMTYTIFSREGSDLGGMMDISGPEWQGGPSSWMQYVHVTDVDASARQARALGGQVKREPTDIPGVGRFAVLQDPGGAVLAIFKPNM